MPSRLVFLDANGWVAMLNEEDSLHDRALAAWRNLGRGGYSVILTDWVVAETGNGLSKFPACRRFADAVQRLLRNCACRIVSIDPALMERALKLYNERPDKTRGLVDCASFVVMQDEGIHEAFTTDCHFEQAGFTCLLPASAT
jgi:predicted nucleic acid-binding protein